MIWSLFYSGISIIQKVHRGENVNWIGVVAKFIVGKSATPFYYIVVLVQLTIITPWLVRVVNKGGKTRTVLWMVTPAYLVLLYGVNCITGKSPVLYETFFLAWFGFYYLGIRVRCGRKLKGSWLMICLTFLFSCAEAFLLRYCGMSRSFYISQITVGSFLFTYALIVVLVQEQNSRESILSRIGDCSYGIFYIHMFVLMVVDKIVGKQSSWLAYCGIRFVLTAAISFLIVRVTQLLLKKHKSVLGWFGFI